MSVAFIRVEGFQIFGYGVDFGVDGYDAALVISEASMMNWNVGKRIKEDVLLNKRADYGEHVLKRLAQRLKAKYGSGWGYQKLQHCVRI